MKDWYDKNLKGKPYKIGDIVYMFVPTLKTKKTKKKLQQSWHGPFIIYDLHGDTNAFLKRLSDGKYIQKSISVLRLKRALLREDTSLWTDLISDNLPDTDIDITDIDDHTMKTLDALPTNDNTNAPDNVPDPTHNQTFQDAVNPPRTPHKKSEGQTK